MIESLRKWGESWSAKVLLGVLAISMGIFWGMGDLFTGRHSRDVVATIGESEILIQDVRRELQLRLALLERKIGQRLTAEQVKNSRLHTAVLMDMVQQTLLDEEATRLSLVIPDAAVKKAVTSNPHFHSEAKTFSREIFQAFLRNQGLYEKAFLDSLKKDMKRQQLLRAFSGTLQMPQLIGEKLLKAQFQERWGAMLTLKASVLKISKPATETLRIFYAQEKERFRLPEKRSLKLVLLDPQKIAAALQVTPVELQQAFEARVQEFKGQTLRDVSESLTQELALKKAQARLYELTQHIEDDLASGLSLEQVAQKYHLTLQEFPTLVRRLSALPKEVRALLPEDPALAQDILNEVFEGTPASEPTLKKLHNGSHYILAIDKVFASEIPPLEIIIKDVENAWIRGQQEEKVLQLARTRASELKSGKLSLRTLEKLPSVSLRRGAQEDLGVPAQVKTILFEMAPGDIRVVQNLVGEAFVVQLLKIEEAEHATIKEQIPAFLDQLQQMYTEDLLAAYIQSLRPRYHVKINREAVNRVL